MGDSLLRADSHDRLAVLIELDVETGLVPVADGAAQARNSLGHRVPVGVGTARGLHQFV